MSAAVELIVKVPKEWWMNANHRTHWRVKATRTKWLRHLAATLARQANLPTALATPVHVEAWVTYPRAGKNDPNNAGPTTKALIDGLTDYGCWPDDDQHHVQGPRPPLRRRHTRAPHHPPRHHPRRNTMTADLPRTGDTITTAAQREALPAAVIVKDAQGSIACRHYSGVGVVFGDDRTFAWDVLVLPLTVLHVHGEQPPSVEDARTEAERQWGEEPDLGDESDHTVWTVGFLAGHHAGAEWAASRAVPSDPPLVAAPCCDSVEACRAVTEDRDRWRRIAEARTADFRDPAVPSDRVITTAEWAALLDRIAQQRFTDDDGHDIGTMPSGHGTAAAGLTLNALGVRIVDDRHPAVPSDHTATTEDARKVLEAHRLIGARCRCGMEPRLDYYRYEKHVAEEIAVAGLLAMAPSTAATEDAARVRERALKRAYSDRQTPIQEDDAWAFGEGVRAGIDAAAGLLATARPDTATEPTDAQVERAAVASAQARRGVTAKVNDTDREAARAALRTAWTEADRG